VEVVREKHLWAVLRDESRNREATNGVHGDESIIWVARR
jgi:hypothetical protein